MIPVALSAFCTESNRSAKQSGVHDGLEACHNRSRTLGVHQKALFTLFTLSAVI
jgi:hypothetical protein